MTRAVMIDEHRVAEEVSEREFYTRVFGHPPKPREQREAERQAYFAKLRAENRRELEEMRDRLCKLASPELQAEWRVKWAEEDRQLTEREARRAAA